MVQWFNGSDEGVVAQTRQRMRGESLGLQVKDEDNTEV